METRAKLARTLKPHWVWAIALGSAIGWGAFVLPAEWMANAGPLGAILGLTIGGVLMLIIAVSYGFMIKNFPVSGGEFAYTYLRFGRDQAFVCAWFLALGYICIVALNASAFGLLGRYVLPGIAERGLMYNLAGWDVYLGEVVFASVVLLAFAWTNIRGAAFSGRTQFMLCLVMVAGVVVIAPGALFHPSTPLSNLQPAFSPDVAPWTAVLAIVAIAPWAYVGFDNIPQAAEEFNFSPRKAFGLIVFALLAAVLLYSAMIFATAIATPWQDLVATKPVWGTGDAIGGLFGVVGTVLLTVAVSMGIFTGLSGFYIASSRLLFALGRAGVLPSAFARLHSRHQTPHVGVLFTCLLCLIAPWFGREALLWVVDMSAVGVTIAYFYTCIVAFTFFRWSTTEGSGGELEGAVAPMKKVMSLLGALCGVIFLGLLVVPGAPGFLGTPSWIALVTWVILGVAFYLSRRKRYRALPRKDLDYQILGKEREEVEPSPASGSEAATHAQVSEAEF